MIKTWRVRRWALLLVFILGSGSTVGCAFQDRHVTLTPPTTVSQTSNDLPTSSDKKIISVARPQDLRSDPTTVGNIRNGQGAVTAQVRSNTDIPMWVANSVIQGLEQAGYHVERVETVQDAPTPVAIDIAVLQVSTEHGRGLFAVNGKGDISAQIEVFLGGRRIRRRRYAGTYEEKKTNIFAHSPVITSIPADEYQVLLDAAMKDFLQKTLSDLARALDKAVEESS